MRQLPTECASLCDRIDRDLEQWVIGLPHFVHPLPGEPRLKRVPTTARFSLKLMSWQNGKGDMDHFGIEGEVSGLVIALRTNEFSALANQVEREFDAVVEAAKKIDRFYKSQRRPVRIKDYGMSLAPDQIDGPTLLNYCLPDCKEAIDRFSQTLSWMHLPIVPAAGDDEEAFGSCPGGPGNAGQGEAQLSPESAPEKSSSAGAHAAILTNENGHETPPKVRTDGAQVRREDLVPELMELCEAVRKQLADIFAKIEGLDFQQTRERLIGKCREFRQYIEDAQPGHEFDDTLPLQFETCWLARRLGFAVGPVAVTHTHESMAEFHKRMGLRLELLPGSVSEAKVDIHLATAYLPYGGRNLTLPIAMYQQRDGGLVGVAHPPLPEENRRNLLGRFDKWITAAGNCLPSDFRPDVRPAKIDYLNALVIHSGELILLWHAPKAAQAAPATAGARDKVFISYSHKDKKFLDELLAHLKPMIREERISIWSDKQIKPGAKLFDDIKLALASTKIAVLLVTKDFLASDFIHEHELEPLLEAARQGEVRVLWIPVRACAYKETPLKDYQALIPPDKPLAEMKAERDGAWVKICEAIKAFFPPGQQGG